MEQNLQLQTSSNLPQIVSTRSLLEIRRTMPRYKDMAVQVRLAWLSEQIIYCNALNHQKPDPKMVLVDTSALDEAMVRDSVVGDYTQPEISFALFHGAMGEYGEFYGLTARTLMGFLREFQRTDIKFYATNEEKKAKEPPRGSWVLERMEYQRRQVQAQWELREAAEAEEGNKPVDTEALRQTVLNASQNKNNH